MAEEIQFNKNVFNKNTYSKVIDTSFTQLGVQSISDQIQNQPTTTDFFNMYNDLFYIIPEKGEINSHEFLIKKSSEYIGFEANQEEIIALQNEIAQLRIELLDTQKQNIDLQISSSNNI
jgi:predicted alpha/beta hydrolase family esterase